MTDFKFLSVKEHPECDEKFLKNLTAGVEYEFYQDYSPRPSEQQSEIQLELAGQKVPENLYNITTLDGKVGISPKVATRSAFKQAQV